LNFLDLVRFSKTAPVWFDELNNLIEGNSKFRLISLVLYGILGSLSLHVSCIQEKDIKDSGVPTADIFSMNFSHFLKWGAVVGNWTLGQKAAVKAIMKSFDIEIRQVQENDEATVKPDYFIALNDCFNVLSNMPL
jgi:hypothetical protein